MASAWSQLDQLLTCAICLDRYRNPKLLPCQHTFCMEPCLDGLIDYARRQIKCPECRAEHRIPYKGIQEYPTNVTLMRFLELHRDITGEEPEPPPSMMERCGVCSEKANLEKCAHCDKKICTDCKEAHIDILRREINRINNQVRRGLHRLADALSQTKKNAEKLQQNCSQVKDEIEDIVRRYAKDLKHTEEKLKMDLQMYTETELKAISKLKEDLEAEVSNMSSNCDLVDKHIKDDEEWSDAELLEYKDIFIKMLDFLRSFDADTTDYSRKIKFQPRADPDVLHRNIADFGELKINAPPSSSISQQSLAPPSSNALMRSQSDHRLAAQFARRTEGRSFADRYGGSDSERDPGRPTSPLYGRGRRETDSSSGYRRYTRDYDSDRSNRYTREENVSSSSILSSRWRDSDEYGHRSSRYPRDYEDYDSEPQQQHSRSVRFADDPQPRERIFVVDEATKGPLSGVIRLMDSPKLMERLHQNEVRQKQQQTEKEKIQSQVETPPIVETRAPVAPQAPPRKTPVRQASEDDIDRQKKANQANSSTSSNTQSVPSTQDALSRSTSHKPSIETTKTQTQVPVRAQPKELLENSAPTTAEISNSIERQETRVRKQPSIAETVEEPEITTPSITRRSKPALGKTVISDGRGSTTTQQQPELTAANTSDTKPTSIATSHPSLLALRSKRHENEENNRKEEVPIPAQSSFFSRQRRLPDPEPRLLENQTSEEDDDEDDDDVDEDDDDDEEEEDDTEDEDDVKLPSADLKLQQSANKSSTEDTVEESESEESSTESSTTESESEDSDAVEDDNRGNGVQGSSHDADNKTTTTTYRSPTPKYESPLDDDEDDDDDCEVEDAIDYCSQNQTLSNDKKLPSASIDTNASRTRFRRRSDDLDTADSSSGSSSSTNYKSFSNTPTILSNGNVENNSVDSENNSSNSSHRREPRFANVRKRPTLARSKSSHELGLGYEDKEEVDDDDEVLEDSNVTPKYRSRSDRSSEDNIIHQRPCRKYGSLSSDNHSSMESATGLSPTSSSWATYLKNKYSGNGTGRVVPRSRSSHSLYQKTDSESSDDEPSSSVLGGSMSFPNARSTYMQKRRMLFKIGSRGTEPGNFTWPRGIAVGPEDSIVVADSSNHRVQVFDVEGHFSFEFGSYGSSEGQFDCLSGVSVNRIGQFIVSDRYNHRVQLFDPSGRFLRAFGSEGHTDGRFNYPWGITTDSLGFIYVCDKDNHRVQVFQSDGTFVGKFGCLGSRPGQLEHPHYIAVSNTNRVVVSDSNNHRVQIYDVNGRTLSTFGSEGSGEGQFKFPRGVAVDDQGFIIVGDSGNNRIQIFHPDGTFLRGFGTWGSGEGEFKGLEGIAVASSGNILVCDRENHRIQVF